MIHYYIKTAVVEFFHKQSCSNDGSFFFKSEVGHLIVQFATHLLAGIVKTKELIVLSTLIRVLPKCEHIVIWHHDSRALVVPALHQKLSKVHFYILLSVTKRNLKRTASAIVILVDKGSRLHFRFWHIEVLEVRHLIVKECAHRLAGVIKTIEQLEATTHIWVLPDFEHIVIWHHDSSALVIPSLLKSQCFIGPL